MRKWRTLLCLALLIALVPAALRLRRALPLDPQPLIEEKYGGWAGVLRLWVCEGWLPGGGAAAWLNRWHCRSTLVKITIVFFIQQPHTKSSNGFNIILLTNVVLNYKIYTCCMVKQNDDRTTSNCCFC